MFQTFENTADPTQCAPRLKLLRDAMTKAGVDGFLVPRADEHQGEYVSPASERLRWLTGFSGSAGAALVLADRAVMFVDGRYTLQVRDQVDMGCYDVAHLIDEPPAKWLQANARPGQRIGFDPWLATVAGTRKLREGLSAAGAELVAIDNLIDRIWAARPHAPKGRVTIQSSGLTGSTPAEKIGRVQQALAEKKADLGVTTQPDCIAWLFDIRGADVPHTPFALSFALIPAKGRPRLFIDDAKLGPDERAHIEAVADVVPPEGFVAALAGVGADTGVLLDPQWASDAIAAALTAAGARLIEGDDPITLMKATKSAAELAGARTAHVRDGIAMARFLKWFDDEAPKGHLDEIKVVKALEGFRRDTGQLLDVSFDTISGAGPNGAIVHYRVTEATNRAVKMDEPFLIDSGAQFRDGTTDITRTLAVGTVSDEVKDRYTRVLKGNIALSTARFPAGTTGAQLEVLARLPLWQGGFNYDHGTGHGIGSYLSVHEGPQGFSKINHTPLKAGMILSNEPGYYKTGGYGIRIENLMYVTELQDIGGDRPMHGFEVITLAPIDTRLIMPSLMTPAEIGWLNDYHARVLAEIGPHLDEAGQVWLRAATKPIA